MQFFSKKVNRSSHGFTLVETLVAISIFTMSLLGITSILASSISNTGYAKQKILAGYLAQEGIEYVRNMRDTYILYSGTSQAGWDAFKVELNPCNSGNGCGFVKPVAPFDVFVCSSPDQCKLYVNNGGYDTNSGGTDSGFIRKIWMTRADGSSDVGSDEEVKIFSEVEWTQGSGNYSIVFSENLFNWL